MHMHMHMSMYIYMYIMCIGRCSTASSPLVRHSVNSTKPLDHGYIDIDIHIHIHIDIDIDIDIDVEIEIENENAKVLNQFIRSLTIRVVG